MEFMKDWKVVKSKLDSHPHGGYPMGQILFKNLKDAEAFVQSIEFKDCIIEDYKHEE